MRRFWLLVLIAFVPLLAVCQFVNNYDTCRTQTYYQYIGNSTTETHIEKARTVQDNGIINAGYSRQGSSQNALIIKQNINGQVSWQKEYGNAAYDEQFTDWRELPDKQLLLGGIAKNQATKQSVFFMMLLSADGNIIWQKTYTDIATPSNITNAKIYPDYYGEYFFAAETDSVIVYGMTSNTGALNWQMSFNTNPGTKLIAAVSYYGQLLIATNAVDSGYHVSNFYYVDYYWTGHPQTIKYTTKLGGQHQNSNYILHDFEQYSQYTYFSGIRSVGNAPYELIRVNRNQGLYNEAMETIATPGVVINSLTRTAINAYGDVVSFTAGRKNDNLHTVQLTGSENFPTNVVWSSSYHLPDSIVLKGNIKTWDNGYVFFGFKELPGGNKKIIQLKTDSASFTAGCINRRSEIFTLVRNEFPPDTVRYSYNNLHGLADLNNTASANTGIIDTLILCKELKCPQIPLSDNCLDSYQKLYKSYEPGSFSNSVQVVNGRVFVCGYAPAIDYIPEGANTFIAEMNKNGQVVNQKKFVPGNRSYSRMFKGQDSSLLLYGNTSDEAYHPSNFLAKIDTNLNVIWMKFWQLTTGPQYASNQSFAEVKQSGDGSYFLAYSDGISFGETTIYLTKLDANGNLLWTKVYRASYPGNANLIKAERLEVSGGNVYIMCVNGYNDYAASILLKVTENNGNLLWCKKYSNPNEHLDLAGLTCMYNNELLIGGTSRDDNSDDRQNILLKADPDGKILKTVTYKNMETNTAPLMQFMNNGSGNIYMNSVFYANPPYSNPYQVNVTVNNNFGITASKKRPSFLYTRAGGMAVGKEGQLYETGGYASSYNYNTLLYLIKFSPDGSVGTCPSDTMLLQAVTPPPISITDINCVQSDTFFTVQAGNYRADQYFLATTKLVCASVPGCNLLDVTGSDSICDKSLQYTFRAVRNNGCNAPLQWFYDNTNVQVVNETDSFITLRFSAAGSLLLKARFTSNCIVYQDSLLIHINSDAPALDLGADTSLCAGASLLVNAKKGFKSYQWQDGSADSTFNVTTAGLYYITVTDSCNNFFRDSISVQLNGSGPILNLGADSNFCSANAILLNAHAGFLTYKWQDGSIDSVFSAIEPGSYYVTVTDACTNSFTDTVKLSLPRKAISLNLGADTIFCSSISMQLNTGAGFKSYLWQDGSADSTFNVITAGLYYVTVTDSCNNLFRDSISVQLNGSGPILNLGADSNFCSTNAILLNAHAGFLTYLWQDGSTDSVFNVTKPGLYFVTVTDACNNSIRDTVKISSYRRAASLSLGADTVFCGSVTMQLNAGAGFKNYLWQDGSVDTVFKAKNIGLYYVRVTDSCGTVFTDSINIIPDNIIAFDIGRDTAICKNDSLLLRVTAGLNNYVWWSAANFIQHTPTEITVFPSTDMRYYVSAIKRNGCMVSDSILVTVHLPSFINLGPDTDICADDTLTLNAGPGFNNYIWSTGEKTISINAYQAGLYSVTATDNNNCIAGDTLSILQVVTLPATQLLGETAICRGQSTALHAGAGFTSYIWNTGATTESITVTAMGQYNVTVMNAVGCSRTDTVNINRELALPSGFIKDKDSTICVFETMTLAPSQSYSAYLWSTGSTASSVVINKAGNYWLKVTDTDGCTGTDSFTLATKECNIGVYFPNSFTPNDDGLNDRYKPKAYGRLSLYHIVIYNRYGERVFDSRNVEEGWTGVFKGAKQETGVFIWQCTYQLSGGIVQNKSGTVMLIR